MTTIVYKHEDREIAYDSLVTSGGTIVENNCNKFVKIYGSKYFTMGDDNEIEMLIDAEKSKLTLCDFECEAALMTYLQDRGCMMLVTIEGGKVIRDFYACDWAIGSGGEFALGAMDFGANAREAVKVAIGRDIYSGGRIRSVKYK